VARVLDKSLLHIHLDLDVLDPAEFPHVLPGEPLDHESTNCLSLKKALDEDVEVCGSNMPSIWNGAMTS